MKHKKTLSVLTACCFFIFVLNNCIDAKKQVSDYRGSGYAGSAKCENCHKEIYDTYLRTPHHLTSSPATQTTIKGSFKTDSNVVQYRSSLKVVMENTDSGFYQVAYLDNTPKQAARFDMVIGSGSKGQSYLSWLNDIVFQLPVSYLAPGAHWMNSPGYPPGYVLFNRNIPVGCFECHSSYIKKTDTRPSGDYLVDYFDRSQIIYGIDCERCHGPLAAHVKYQEENHGVASSQFVTNIESLSRQEKTDMCAVCHSGAGETTASSFYYKPGAKLSEYIHLDKTPLRTEDIDVHGKQYQLLMASKCFIKSKTLTCLSCHNPHGDAKDKIQEFSKTCMTCHENPIHTSINVITDANNLTLNCIDCHMPAKPSQVITMKSADKDDSISAYVRTHYIAIYKKQTGNISRNK